MAMADAWTVRWVVSGGQTGVDRAALDVAIQLGIPHGGWCPRGRRAEDGAIPRRYRLRETPLSAYRQRTAWNVRDSDATLVLSHGPLQGGTALTVCAAARLGRPCIVADPAALLVVPDVRARLEELGVACLNVAGPRASQQPGIYELAYAFVLALLASPASR